MPFYEIAERKRILYNTPGWVHICKLSCVIRLQQKNVKAISVINLFLADFRFFHRAR